MASDAVVNLVVDATGADRSVRAQLTRIVNDAERRAPTVDLRVDLDTSRLRDTIREQAFFSRTQLQRQLGDLGDILTDSLDRGFQNLAGRMGDLDARLSQIADRADTTNSHLADFVSTLRDVGDAERGIGDGDGLRRVGDDADDADGRLSRLLGTFGGFARAGLGVAATSGRLLALTSVASTTIPVVAGLVTELVNMAPAAAVGVSALVGVTAATQTLKLGLSGVSDAVSEVFALDQDPKKLAEAIKNLSPNARAFVGQLQGMRQGFLDLRLDTQDRLFRGLDKTLAATARTTVPVLRAAVRDFADVFNRMGRDVGTTAQTLSKDGTLGTALNGSVQAFANLERLPGQVLNAIFKLAAGGSPALKRITDGIASIAGDLTTKLNDAAVSGGLEDAINGAIGTISQLGRIAGNVFGTLGNIFSVADESGGGLFNTLEKITQALQDATGSTEFQETLATLVDLGNTLVTSVLPLLIQAFQILAPVVQTVVPPIQELVTLIADRLKDVLDEMGPILEKVALNFDKLVVALTPLVDEGLKVLIESLPFVNDLLDQVSLLIEELTPLIAQLAPLIGVALVGAIVILVETAAFMVTTLTNIVDAIKTVIDIALDFGETLFDVVVLAIKAVGDLLDGDFSGAWNKIKGIVGEVGGFIGRTVGEFADLVMRQIRRLIDLLPSGARRAFDGLVNSAKNGVTNTVSALGTLGSRAADTISRYASRFYNAGRSLVSSFVSGIKSMISSAIGAAKDLVGSVTDWLPGSPAKRGPLSGRGYSLYRGMSLSQDFARGILSSGDAVDRAMSSLVGRSTASLPGPSLSVAGSFGSTGLLTAPRTTVRSSVAAPNVSVYIGNDRLTGYVQRVVDDNNRQRDRFAAQGTGR